MNPYWADREFLAALGASPTFWPLFLEWGGAALGLLGVLGALLRWLGRGRGRRLDRLGGDERGSAGVIDFMLTFPIFFALVLIVVQIFVVLNDFLIVHYAAYSAARSARVWLWDVELPRVGSLGSGQGFHNPLVHRNWNKEEVRRQVGHAARMALIPAAPAAIEVPSQPKDLPEGAIRALVQAGGRAQSLAPLLRQARYAFDPANSQVEFGLVDLKQHPQMAVDLVKWGDAWPVTAQVTFRLYLAIPVAQYLGQDRGDGHFIRPVTAEVTLL